MEVELKGSEHLTLRPARAYNTIAKAPRDLRHVPLVSQTLSQSPECEVLEVLYPTVAIETHGCKLNQADSGRLAAQFSRQGFRIVPPDEPSGVFVLNTCTVTHVADSKARRALRAARRRNPDATVVATGCYVQRSPEAVRALEEVDIAVGNTDKETLVRQVVEWREEVPVPCAIGSDEDVLSPRIMRTRATVKIQEGCDQVCAYCIVPKVRGRERSVRPEIIVDEINRYAAAGYREVVLTGTQLGSYGFDLPDMSLVALIRQALAGTSVERLRVSSLQAQEISHELLDLWTDGRLCPHFHLPLQSGSDAVLSRMRRRYTAGQYVAAVAAIRDAVPGAAITADAIVGFPGETPYDFDQTMGVSDQVGFAAMHVFPYSARPGTSAAHYNGEVHPATKAARVGALMALAKDHAAWFRSGLLGQTRPVLWEERRDSGVRWRGLTDNYVRVECESLISLANKITPTILIAIEGDVVLARAQ